MKGQKEQELIRLCFMFLKCITMKYVRGEITKEKYQDYKQLKIEFLKKCGVW
jgi:hypothetical protein